MSVWAKLDIPHGVGDQNIVHCSEYFTAFGRRLRLKLQRKADTNTLELCLRIDPAEAISAVPTRFSYLANAYDPQTPLIVAATTNHPEWRPVYGNVAPALIGWAQNLSNFPGPLSPISHRAKFPADKMVVHYFITKH